MINTQHLLKVSMAWISILYLICFGAVAIYPEVRTLFMKYALHVELDLGGAIMTPWTFVTGFALWNVAAVVAIGLFAILFNRIRQ